MNSFLVDQNFNLPDLEASPRKRPRSIAFHYRCALMARQAVDLCRRVSFAECEA